VSLRSFPIRAIVRRRNGDGVRTNPGRSSDNTDSDVLRLAGYGRNERTVPRGRRGIDRGRRVPGRWCRRPGPHADGSGWRRRSDRYADGRVHVRTGRDGVRPRPRRTGRHPRERGGHDAVHVRLGHAGGRREHVQRCCLDAWPPVTVDGDPVAGDDVAADLTPSSARTAMPRSLPTGGRCTTTPRTATPVT